MADAKQGIPKVVKEEGGFQNDISDTGNFYKGVNYGTKYGITPQAYVSYYGSIQKDTIRNLTIEQATPIYKKKFWDPIRADEILNSSVADLLMFAVVNSGISQIKSIKHIINQVYGSTVVAETNTPLTSAEVKILNALPQDKFFNAFKAYREGFYRALAAKDAKKQKYLKGWLNRLNKHVYSGSVSSSESSESTTVLTFLFLGLVGLALLK